MNRDVAFFNVDTQQPSEDRTRLVFRTRVEPIAEGIAKLLRHAVSHDIFVVSTACVNAGPVHRALHPETMFVSMDASPASWTPSLLGARALFLEKRTCGGPEANTRERAYDVFHSNPNAGRVIRALDIPRWVVFGDSAGYCVRSTVEGLLALGCEVSIVADVVGKGIDSDEASAEVLRALERQGASLDCLDDVLAERQ